jgi:hypothetical protein
MLAAMIGGLIVSITLFIMKRTMTRETTHVQLTKTDKFPIPRMALDTG